MSTENTCANCRFAKLLWTKGEKYKYPTGSFGEMHEAERYSTDYECRRHAPRGMVAVPENAYGVERFAHMKEDDWCGQWRIKL